MTLTNEDIIKLRDDLRASVDSTSLYYGRLLEWQDFLTNHYGIGLSNEYLFSTGEIFSVIKTEGKTIKLTPTPSLPPTIVIQRLIYALDCFKNWHYGLLGWNCEHYSRLVVTNESLSYQVMYSPLAWLNHGGYHPTAVKDFNEYLNFRGLNDLIQ
ncbi:hypothetical protein [Chroococcus sp. FPU101]|uniref:hypothetical protein n=1 Tax=Chroococcus sp. FPU101 TaxID=1974212 RepID=UPI001A904352|nr:hypothetical protein [Chroococcus sp. FPU101]GFE70045.1 hypothetical protein CFPU101_26550 [Chroococcus sp. FPU101]